MKELANTSQFFKKKLNFLKRNLLFIFPVLLIGILAFQPIQNDTLQDLNMQTDTSDYDRALRILSNTFSMEESEIADLISDEEISELLDQFHYSKIHTMQFEIDSLNGVIYQLINGKNIKTVGNTKEVTEIHKMIDAMHNSWEELYSTKDPDEILQYFLPNFITNKVFISSENQGRIESHTNADFKKFLKESIKTKGLSYKFGNIRFLDTEIKDNKYFTVTYKSNLRIYEKAEFVKTNSILVTVTGRFENKEWRIGNYSWVSFQYKE